MKQIIKTATYLLFTAIFTATGLYFGNSTIWLAAIMMVITGVFDFTAAAVACFLFRVFQRVEQPTVENGQAVKVVFSSNSPVFGICMAVAKCSCQCSRHMPQKPYMERRLSRENAEYLTAAVEIGRFNIGAGRFYVESPLGLFRLRSPKGLSRSGFPCSVLIIPRVHTLKPFLFYPTHISDIDPRLTMAHSSADQVAGVRLYEKGDPLRTVNWKLTASRQQLYVRQFESDSLELSAPLHLGYMPQESSVLALEGAMSAGAALLANRPITLSTWRGDKLSFPKGDTHGLARALAVIEGERAEGQLHRETRLGELQHEGQCAVVLCRLEDEMLAYIYALKRGSIVVLCGECVDAELDLENIREYGINIYFCTEAGELICPITD